MGQTLSEPVVDKTSERGGDDRLLYGLSAMQGWRISMEDSHTAILDLIAATDGRANGTDSTTSSAPAQKLSFFGVYDGHGGHKVALYAGENLYNIVTKQEKFRAKDYVQALKDGFLATDSAILSDPRHEDEVSGCTACVGLISDDKVYVANAGDSRCVLGTKGRAKPLSEDHKPQLEGEKARIQAAGGFVDFGRVNGNLALSRAIGDFEFKKGANLSPEAQIVTALPDVSVHELTDDDEFLVVACDGIWDCQSSQSVVEFVRRGIVARQELDHICENMMDNCLASNSETGGVGCDNMTIIIIALLRGRTKEEWYDEISRRVAAGEGPCAPPEYAEFRGPGVHHSRLNNGGYHGDDDEEEEDEENWNGGGPVGPYRGRIILLGDGLDRHSDSDNSDVEMVDKDEEDMDLNVQVLRDGVVHIDAHWLQQQQRLETTASHDDDSDDDDSDDDEDDDDDDDEDDEENGEGKEKEVAGSQDKRDGSASTPAASTTDGVQDAAAEPNKA